ncbi:MAG: RidA family protein [Treponema sp.]|nr:RidA family protein [Treponema sp.]
MIKKMPTHCGDDTCSSCVIAGDFIFLAHHAGHNYENANDIVGQVRATFENLKRTLSTVNAALDDIVEIKFYLKNKDDFRKGADVFREYFTNGAPARMTIFTDFLDDNCLCMMDGIAYKQRSIII